MPVAVGQYIADLKGACTAAWREGTGCGEPFFSSGFRRPDRIAPRAGFCPAEIYRRQSPPAMDKASHNPDFFMRRHRLSIAGCDYEAIGNIFLLNDMDIRAVRISRRFQPEELHDLKVCWLRTIENGGVLVSPFISVAEKRVRDYAIANGARLDSDRAEWVRAAPTSRRGNIFELCAEGRLLMVAPG